MTRTGRRPGESGTRRVILAAAREAFTARGYDAVTIRRIAAAAEVDPALVHYHFGTKEGLFHAVAREALPPAELLARSFSGAMSGERLVLVFLTLWEEGGGALAGTLLRRALTGADGARLAAGIVQPALVRALEGRIPEADVPLRASLLAAQLGGLVIARYVLQLEPLAGASREDVAAVAGPAVQCLLARGRDA